MYVIKYCIDFAGRNVYGLDLQENKTAGSAWNVDYRYCARSVCIKYAGYKASWHIGRFKKNRPDYYSDKSGAWTGFNELKKNRKTCGFNVLCAGNV